MGIGRLGRKKQTSQEVVTLLIVLHLTTDSVASSAIVNVDCIPSKLYTDVISCSAAPRHGVLHDPVPADSQSGEEVQCLKERT